MRIAWNKGLKMSEKQKEKLRKPKSEECKKKISNAKKGKHLSENHKKQISLGLTGELNPFYGKQHTIQTKQKISNANKGRKFSNEVNKKKGLPGKLNPFYGKKHSDETRAKISEKHRNCMGENNPMYNKGYKIKGKKNGSWQGGISNEPYTYEFNEELKRKIRERDNYTCVICNNKGYSVHHIDYNKKNSNEKNLITLCKKDHMKTNFNRESWIEFFKPIINKLYE
jgi:hypothetical protein